MSIVIPGLGAMTKDERLGWLYSPRIVLHALGVEGRIVVEGYEEDEAKGDYHVAIANFLSADTSILTNAQAFIFRYYEDMNSSWSPSDEQHLLIASPQDVWAHIRLGNEPMVSRRRRGDMGIYISLECNCDWEPEHGLQIVFKNGQFVNKVGAFDGHLTNSDAWKNGALEDVVYR